MMETVQDLSARLAVLRGWLRVVERELESRQDWESPPVRAAVFQLAMFVDSARATLEQAEALAGVESLYLDGVAVSDQAAANDDQFEVPPIHVDDAPDD